jgi:hypothetical protein
MNHLCWVNHAIELGFAYETELKRKVVVKGVVRDLAAALSPSFASKAKFCPTCCRPHIGPLAGNTSVLMAITSGPSEPFKDGFRRLRNSRSAFLDAAQRTFWNKFCCTDAAGTPHCDSWASQSFRTCAKQPKCFDIPHGPTPIPTRIVRCLKCLVKQPI